MRKPGEGNIRVDGYKRHTVDGKEKLDHVAVAEKALGRKLPKGAVVHHHDEVRGNNEPSNLVICPGQSYHLLLHKRMRAVDACGHADWRPCNRCGVYDDPQNMYRNSKYPNVVYHRPCEAKYARERKIKKLLKSKENQ